MTFTDIRICPQVNVGFVRNTDPGQNPRNVLIEVIDHLVNLEQMGLLFAAESQNIIGCC